MEPVEFKIKKWFLIIQTETADATVLIKLLNHQVERLAGIKIQVKANFKEKRYLLVCI